MKSWLHLPRILSLVTLALALSQCAGFGQPKIESAPISDDYKNYRSKHRLVYIQNFDNRTYSPQLTGRLKDKLNFSLARLGTLTVTTEKSNADLVLYGKIHLYTEEAGVFDNASSPLTYNLTLVVSAKLRIKNRPDTDLAGDEQHTVSYVSTYNIGAPYFETRYNAEDRLLEGISDRIAMVLYDPKEAEK